MEYKKKFLIIGNMNNVTYLDIIPHIMNGEIWLGKNAGHFWFRVPDYYEEKKTDFKIDETGQKWRRMGNICWYTNLDYPARHEDMILYKHYDPAIYPKYDDFDAIDVKLVKDIPCDYFGIMGIPISGMNKISPDQFEILGKIDSGKITKYNLANPRINGKNKATFPEYMSEMKGVEWGLLYNEHKDKTLDPEELKQEIHRLVDDDDVTNVKGIFAYLLDGNEKHLNLRAFDESVDLVNFAFEHAEPGDLFIQKADASTIGDLADGVMKVFGITEKKIIGNRHGEKLYEILMTKEECLRSIDMGHYYRVVPDVRGLNYDKTYVEGTVVTEGEAYTSHNTDRLDVDSVVKKLMENDYVREELEGRPHIVEI